MRFFTLLLLITSCRKERPPPIVQSEIVHANGLKTQILAEGDGDEAKQGDKIEVNYVGRLSDGGVFDSTRISGHVFSFWVGEGMVIKGWDEGILGMREGEIRRITVPPALGYGSNPPRKIIPPNETLTFEVELTDVR